MRLSVLTLLVFALAPWAAALDWNQRAGALETARGAELERVEAELIAGGMPAHEALKSGSAATAALRGQLRRAIRARRDRDALARGLVMHEWGAFSYFQGIDIARMEGDPTVGSDLPPFAQVFSELGRRNAFLEPPGAIDVLKPIVYFYTDKPRTIRFSVALPHGMFTQWTPKASTVNPDPASGLTITDNALGGITGLLVWRDLRLLPADAPPLPAVPKSAWWWPICRDTDSAVIQAGDEAEKFIFYRGILTNSPPLISVDGGVKQQYVFTNTSRRETVRHLLLIHVEKGRAMAKQIPAVAPGASIKADLHLAADAEPADGFAPRMRDVLAQSLEEAGLFPKEAAGMARIWQKPYFETDGVRIVYLNPPAATGTMMPIELDPHPAESIRTILISVECLKDSKENVIRQLIIDLGAGSYAVREAAQRRLLLLGSQAEPALRGTLKATHDEEVRNRIGVILKILESRGGGGDVLPHDILEPDNAGGKQIDGR